MMEGLPWEAIYSGLGIVFVLFGMLIRIDRRISKLWALFDINNREHKQIRGRLKRQGDTLDNHEQRISTLEGREVDN
jgi:hypothetical protein